MIKDLYVSLKMKNRSNFNENYNINSIFFRIWYILFKILMKTHLKSKENRNKEKWQIKEKLCLKVRVYVVHWKIGQQSKNDNYLLSL